MVVEGWWVVSISKLEATFPGSLGCRGMTVGYGFEVAWERGK